VRLTLRPRQVMLLSALIRVDLGKNVTLNPDRAFLMSKPKSLRVIVAYRRKVPISRSPINLKPEVKMESAGAATIIASMTLFGLPHQMVSPETWGGVRVREPLLGLVNVVAPGWIS